MRPLDRYPVRRIDRHDERGVVLILVAMIMLALLIMVAIVVDLGQQRAARRSAQSATDIAGLAAGYFLTGRAGTPRVIDAESACEAAINSIQTDITSFTPQLSAAERDAECAAFPDGASTPLCAAGSTYPDVSLTRGPYLLTIHYPVTAADLAANPNSANFSGAGTKDGTDECARMSISLRQTNQTSFAQVIGVNETQSAASSVVKGGIERSFENVAALTLLERSNCVSLSTGGQGIVEVDFSDATNPGRIQADSSGLTSPAGNCTITNNEQGHVVWAGNTGNAQIKVNPTPGGDPGSIGIYSLTPGVNGRGGAEYQPDVAIQNGLNVQPTPGKIGSRLPADLKYNTALPSITDLHTRAYSLTAVGSPPAGTVTTISGAGCNPNSSQTIAGAIVYVNCANFSVTGNGTLVDFSNATDVYFTGNISIANNATLGFPIVQRLYVRGCRNAPPGSNCGNQVNNAFSINVAGTLYVNRAGFGPCPSITNQPAPPGALTHNIVEVATLGGPIIGTGSIAFCQTFVYIGRLAPTYAKLQTTSGPPNCTATKPCPATGVDWVDEGYIRVTGGSTSLHWSAPNRTQMDPSATNPFEDLAVWAEGSRASVVKGTGSSQTTGVYFLPNSNITFTGQGNQLTPLNAQYMSRSLVISGLGKLFLKPNPNDSLKTESPGSISLIR